MRKRNTPISACNVILSHEISLSPVEWMGAVKFATRNHLLLYSVEIMLRTLSTGEKFAFFSVFEHWVRVFNAISKSINSERIQFGWNNGVGRFIAFRAYKNWISDGARTSWRSRAGEWATRGDAEKESGRFRCRWMWQRKGLSGAEMEDGAGQ